MTSQVHVNYTHLDFCTNSQSCLLNAQLQSIKKIIHSHTWQNEGNMAQESSKSVAARRFQGEPSMNTWESMLVFERARVPL